MSVCGPRCALGALLLVGGVLNAEPARAERPAPQPEPSALQRVPRALAAQLHEALRERAPSGTTVACAPLRSAEPLPRADALVRRVCAALATALPGARLLDEPSSMQSALKLASAGTPVTFVELEIAAGELRASATVQLRSTNVWARLKQPAPAPIGQAYAAATLDAELRSYLPPLNLEQASAQSYRHDLGEVQALACAPLAGAPGNQLALWTASELVIGRLHSGALQVLRRVPHEQIGVRAPVPMRPPLAAVVYTGQDEAPLAVGSSSRRGALLDRALRPTRVLEGLPVDVGEPLPWCAPWEPLAGAVRGRAQPCGRGAESSTDPLYDAQVGARLVERSGAVWTALALRETSGRLWLSVGTRQARLDAVGAQIALGDIDQDGQLELVYALDSREDALAVATFDGERLRLRKRVPTRAPVRAVAVCPPESNQLQTVVAAGDQQIWALR